MYLLCWVKKANPKQAFYKSLVSGLLRSNVCSCTPKFSNWKSFCNLVKENLSKLTLISYVMKCVSHFPEMPLFLFQQIECLNVTIKHLQLNLLRRVLFRTFILIYMYFCVRTKRYKWWYIMIIFYKKNKKKQQKNHNPW